MSKLPEKNKGSSWTSGNFGNMDDQADYYIIYNRRIYIWHSPRHLTCQNLAPQLWGLEKGKEWIIIKIPIIYKISRLHVMCVFPVKNNQRKQAIYTHTYI